MKITIEFAKRNNRPRLSLSDKLKMWTDIRRDLDKSKIRVYKLSKAVDKLAKDLCHE